MSKHKTLHDKMKAHEKLNIWLTLIKFDGNKPKTAKHLGISLSSLYRKIKELKILDRPWVLCTLPNWDASLDKEVERILE